MSALNYAELNIKQIKTLLAQCPSFETEALLTELAHDPRDGVQKLIAQSRRKLEKQAQAEANLAYLKKTENSLRQKGYHVICGCDEVGRGPLAGPVVAAAVIMPEDCRIYGVNDSKKLNAKQREELSGEIHAKAVAAAIAEISPRIIDAVNILQASRLAMAEAVKKINETHPIDIIAVDGWANPMFTLPQEAIIKGDSKCFSISCASIIAKVYRDHLMEDLDRQYPGYNFAQNKGYPTKEHYEALKRLGPSDIHRISFDLKLS